MKNLITTFLVFFMMILSVEAHASKVAPSKAKAVKKGPRIAHVFTKKRAAALRKWQNFEVDRRRFTQRFTLKQS